MHNEGKYFVQQTEPIVDTLFPQLLIDDFHFVKQVSVEIKQSTNPSPDNCPVTLGKRLFYRYYMD